jgi:hypothetical protein
VLLSMAVVAMTLSKRKKQPKPLAKGGDQSGARGPGAFDGPRRDDEPGSAT